MFCEYCSNCAKCGDAVSVSVTTYKVNVNSALQENPKDSSSTISVKGSIDNGSIKEVVNVNKVLSALIEQKWDRHFFQTLSAQVRQNVLRRILEKVFITKKCTQCTSSHTIKTIDICELPDNKNIRKLFSKHELLFLFQKPSDFKHV